MANENTGNTGNTDPIKLQKALKGLDYPATRGALISAARDNQADDGIINALMRIPEKNYEDPTQVSEAVAAHRDDPAR
ncbi:MULTISPECIES: DUF2795 domain-containing protein [unclassified Cupriavidus]|uniref:DUF2795 domain-containing protein n=1 Tax=unclassified Cupriavidus TaxID=2640874 RepID=UPI001BFFFB1A|nr:MULTISPECIES: DUF2795 domain-containing protein [unclassified Cupriavidus]MCA3186706.1 DUF2795 domain-containing protein [Cupriavidus sp.]MCA3191517.1 DUF2795 domain-containing protein [Cupriavidus sp.]MCA3199888.1 DUF2795 domain-containing protein [Cupriavidus sp.]MCA3201722.1 DUF2795 domain-containing protein [Cupriavidus sp.]MCA3234877.1 DUF2795 domain-containing protein [Cupriavidus sp.]